MLSYIKMRVTTTSIGMRVTYTPIGVLVTTTRIGTCVCSTRIGIRVTHTRIGIRVCAARIWIRVSTTRIWVRVSTTRIGVRVSTTRIWVRVSTTRIWVRVPSVRVLMEPGGDYKSHVWILVDQCRACARVRRWVGNWRVIRRGHPLATTKLLVWVDSMTAGGIGMGVGVAMHHTWGIVEDDSHRGFVSARKLVGGGGWLMMAS